MTSSGLLKNNKSASTLAIESAAKPEVASFKKKAPPELQKAALTSAKSSLLSPTLKSTISPRVVPTTGHFSAKQKPSAGTSSKLQAELVVSRVLDFTEPDASRIIERIDSGLKPH